MLSSAFPGPLLSEALTFAQSPDAVSDATQQVLWSVLAIVVAIVVVIVTMLVARRWMRGAMSEDDSPGFTLRELRRMHEQGKLSDIEWESVRNAFAARTWNEASGEKPDNSGSNEGDSSSQPGDTFRDGSSDQPPGTSRDCRQE